MFIDFFVVEDFIDFCFFGYVKGKGSKWLLFVPGAIAFGLGSWQIVRREEKVCVCVFFPIQFIVIRGRNDTFTHDHEYLTIHATTISI